MDGDCMLKNMMVSVFIWLLIAPSTYARLPDFTEMVKAYGDAVVNISSTQKAPDFTKNFSGQEMPEGIPPQMEELFRHFFKQPGGGFQPRDTK